VPQFTDSLLFAFKLEPKETFRTPSFYFGFLRHIVDECFIFMEECTASIFR